MTETKLADHGTNGSAPAADHGFYRSWAAANGLLTETERRRSAG